MRKVLIVGGGFAGIRTARCLRKQKNLHITLLSDSHSFRYCPALYRTATGFTMRVSKIPIKDVVSDCSNLKIVYARASKIDSQKKTVTTNTGTVIHYDIVVLALGSVTNFFGMDSIREHAYSISSPGEIYKLRKHIHQHITDEHSPDKNYVVVGGGPTGVEVAAGMTSYLHGVVRKHRVMRRKINIVLIEASDRILPNMSTSVSTLIRKRLVKIGVRVKTHTKVLGESSRTLQTNNHNYPTETVIWSAGVSNNPFFERNNTEFKFNFRGYVMVNENLQSYNNVFVIGDNSAVQYSGLAQSAVHNASYVAKQIKRLVQDKELIPYKPHKPIIVIPVGRRWAIFQIGPFIIKGYLGFVVRTVADFIGYYDIMRLSLAYSIWRAQDDKEESCNVCNSNRAKI